MGKTKRFRNGARKQCNPVGVPSNRDVEELMSSVHQNERAITVMLEQLESPNEDEKLCGLQTLSILSSNSQKSKEILETEAIRIVIPFLNDPNVNIQHATAGALRNLSIGGIEVCECLVEQDILTPLLALLKGYAISSDWIPTFDKSIGNQLDAKSDIFLHTVNLLWNLCESTSAALDCLNQSDILQGLLKCLNSKVFGINIAVSVAQCLLVVSEDNPTAWRVFNDFTTEFVAILQSTSDDYNESLLRTLMAGIMSNVPVMAESYQMQIIHCLGSTLNINHRKILGDLTSSEELLKDCDDSGLEVLDDTVMADDESEEAGQLRRQRENMPTEIERKVMEIERLIDAQRIAVETITNICSPDEEYMDDSDDVSDAESVHDYERSTHSSLSNVQNSEKLSVSVLEYFNSVGLVQQIWNKAQTLPDNVMAILQDRCAPLIKKIRGLRVSSLICLNNLCNVMSNEDLGGPQSIYGVWASLGQQIFHNNLKDEHIVEATTSLMRATLLHLKSNPELFKDMNENDLSMILERFKTYNESEIRANWLKILGILGAIVPSNLTKQIIEFLVELSFQEDDAWVISEAIDTLMDMFADNDWDQIVYDIGLEQRILQLEKIFKSKVRQQKRSLGDRYQATQTVRTNLSRFIKFLGQQQKTFRSKIN